MNTPSILTRLFLTILTGLPPFAYSAAGAPPVRLESLTPSSSTQVCTTLSAWPGTYVITTCTNLSGAWCNETTQSVTSAGTTEIKLSTLARTQLFVRATDLPNLMRACFEDCDLLELDLSGNPNLRDLRGALNSYTNISMGRGTGPLIWHWCTRDNPQLTQSFQDIMTNFFALQELFIWNDNQHGTFSTGSTSLTEVIAYNNHYTGGTVSGQTHLTRCEFQNNILTNFVLTGCPALQYLDLHNNRLTAQALDAILGELVASSSSLIQADLTQNPYPPTALGLTHYSNLTTRGASVAIDWLTKGSAPSTAPAISPTSATCFFSMRA